MMQNFLAMMKDEEGQGLVEYALIIVLVSIAAIITLGLLGTTVSGVFTTITNAL
ncbi:MAG: Flp family type IVb pilin [Verrucomicrobiota bacterium]